MPQIFCKRILFFSGIFIFRACLSVFCQSPQIQDSDRIHQGDIVEVDVVGSFEFDWRGGLNPEGFLDRFDKTPEQIFARCKAPTELAEAVAHEYSKFLRDPKIEVRIIDRNGRALAYIDGAVKTPQRLRIKRDVYLNELIVRAGGIIDTAGGEISIFRPENASCSSGFDDKNDNRAPKTIKISDLLAGVDGANPKIVSGDIVTVEESQPIYVIGGVNNPRRIDARGEMTLSRAVATAGGISKNGVSSTVSVFRRESGGSKVFEADLEKIASGAIPDPKLQAYDIVDVPQKGVAKRKFAPVVDDRSRSSKRQTIPIRVID